VSVSYFVWSIEMSFTESQLGPYFLQYENLVLLIFKFKISMVFTLYKLSLKLLSSVADPEFCKLTNKKRFLVPKGGWTPFPPPLDHPLKFF
jgi:hypothetical protein